MAKKIVRKNSRKRNNKTQKSTSSLSRHEGVRDYKELLRDLAANPAVRYVAGGIAAAVLTKVATNLSERYPEISNFIKENLDNVEGRLGEFKNGLGESARH
jgi:hypothetical protein